MQIRCPAIFSSSPTLPQPSASLSLQPSDVTTPIHQAAEGRIQISPRSLPPTPSLSSCHLRQRIPNSTFLGSKNWAREFSVTREMLLVAGGKYKDLVISDSYSIIPLFACLLLSLFTLTRPLHTSLTLILTGRKERVTEEAAEEEEKEEERRLVMRLNVDMRLCQDWSLPDHGPQWPLWSLGRWHWLRFLICHVCLNSHLVTKRNQQHKISTYRLVCNECYRGVTSHMTCVQTPLHGIDCYRQLLKYLTDVGGDRSKPLHCQWEVGDRNVLSVREQEKNLFRFVIVCPRSEASVGSSSSKWMLDLL